MEGRGRIGSVRRAGAVLLVMGLGGAGWMLGADGATSAADGRTVTPAGAAGGDRGVPAADPGTMPLFRASPGARRAEARGAGPPVLITVSREAALAAARSGTLAVELPDGTRFPVRHERSESAPDGNWTFIGRVDTVAGALAAVITFGRDGTFGLLPTPDGAMLEITTRAGQAYLRPSGSLVPPGADPDRHPDVLVPPTRPDPGTPGLPPVRRAGGAGSVRADSAAPEGAPIAIGQRASMSTANVTIDLLATYTTNLVALRGTKAAAETEFHNLVAITNQAHADSGSLARFAIAGFAQIDYPAGADNRDLLYDATFGTLPDGADLHGMRDAAAADLVALIRPHADLDPTCGIAWLPGQPLDAYALDPANGFSVSAVEDCPALVLAHELGHNLGLAHDRETSTSPTGVLSYGAFPFSFGYRQDGPPAFATVMAYDEGAQAWLNRFSHPGSAVCAGVACGLADSADSVRSVNLTAGTISRFRDPPGTISVFDAWTMEPSESFHLARVNVRLASPAPAGGVTFDLEVQGGSAEWGVDLDAPSDLALDEITIQAGGTYAWVDLRIAPDEDVEPAETLVVRLENVRGAGVAVHDAEASVTIVDDDTTVRVQGQLVLPPGTPATGEVVVYRKQYLDGVSNVHVGAATPPGNAFAFEAAVGATLEFWAEPPHPLLSRSTRVENVRSPLADVRLPLVRGVVLQGQLQAGKGLDAVPQVILWNPLGDGQGYAVNYDPIRGASPEYAVLTFPGVPMQLDVQSPPAPYVRQLVEVPPLDDDAIWNVELREVPSLTVGHAQVVEGSTGDAMQVVGLTATLSQPAPPEGFTFELALGGTAAADDRFVRTGTYRIYGGQVTAPIAVGVPADDRREPDEVVELLVSGLGDRAWNPGPGSVRILSDDPVRAGDGTCTGSTEWPSALVCQ